MPVVGTKHFAMHTRDIEAAHAALVKAGAEVDQRIAIGRTGMRYFFAKDPDGILIEVVDDIRTWWRNRQPDC